MIYLTDANRYINAIGQRIVGALVLSSITFYYVRHNLRTTTHDSISYSVHLICVWCEKINIDTVQCESMRAYVLLFEE